jgi:hypothetical protein
MHRPSAQERPSQATRMTPDSAGEITARTLGLDRFDLTARQAVPMIEHSLIFGEKWHGL